MAPLKIGIVGCGSAARIHAGRLAALEGVSIVGCADPDEGAAASLAEAVGGAATFPDHQRLLAEARPDVLAIFTPPRAHYRPAMDALQAGCHLFVEKPLSTNAQEAVDIVNLARGRGRVVGVGHQYRLAPSLVEARKRLADGAVGRVRLITATMSAPWLVGHGGPENAWRLDPKVAGGGIVADAGDHLLDALIWTTGRSVAEVAAFQDREAPGLDVVDAVAMRLDSGVPATLALTGVATRDHFELTYFGDAGALRATDRTLRVSGPDPDAGVEEVVLAAAVTSIDADFIAAVRGGGAPCCTAEQAVETVRLQEAIARSAGSGQVVRLATAGGPS